MNCEGCENLIRVGDGIGCKAVIEGKECQNG